jgi:hypothetical protein
MEGLVERLDLSVLTASDLLVPKEQGDVAQLAGIDLDLSRRGAGRGSRGVRDGRVRR